MQRSFFRYRHSISSILIAVALSISTAYARDKPFACQADKAGGLEWGREGWAVKGFKPIPDKFILVMSGDLLTPESVATPLLEEGAPIKPRCQKALMSVLCLSGIGLGTILVFSPVSMAGGVSNISGSIQEDKFGFKSPIIVTTFSCRAF